MNNKRLKIFLRLKFKESKRILMVFVCYMLAIIMVGLFIVFVPYGGIILFGGLVGVYFILLGVLFLGWIRSNWKKAGRWSKGVKNE